MSNPYAILVGLLPKRPLQIGTVDDIVSGVATVSLLEGGKVTARGTTSIGARVFVRDGLIEGAAPSLTVVPIEV